MVILPFVVMMHHMYMGTVEIFNRLAGKLRSGMTNQGAVDAGHPADVLRYEAYIVSHYNDGNFLVQPF